MKDDVDDGGDYDVAAAAAAAAAAADDDDDDDDDDDEDYSYLPRSQLWILYHFGESA